MTELERALVELGGELDFPPTPRLAGRVSARVAAPERPRRRVRRTLVLAFALFVLAVGTAFAVPASRDAILEWFGLQGATVQRVESLPELPTTTAGTGAPAATTGDVPGLGDSVSGAEAARRTGFPIVAPAALAEPDAVYVEGSGESARVSLVYESEDGLEESSLPGVGLLLTQFRGDVTPELIGKLAGQGTIIEPVTVNGEPGIWLEGEPHELFYRDPSGEIVWESLRLAGNTLLWEQGDLLLRLEADVSKAEALRLARSVG